jgi:hypothetical protein
VLSGPLKCSLGRCRIEIKFWPGLDQRRLFFRTEAQDDQSGEAERTSEVSYCGLGHDHPDWRFDRLIDGSTNSYPEDRGRWGVALTF